ncbi:hypothetical protein [Sphingomonas sp. 1P08PE]|uniref:hypothetical protein n=1 Tax=Sphingomonas sp. 1P08PE TaxID=554122 RepID=UPI00399F1FBE
MGSSRRYTGCAYIRLRYKLTGNSKKTESPFAGGSIPTRMTIVGDGIPVPDPRASGFNPSDQNTWSTVDSACRNPALVMLAYLLGWRINGKLAVGKGIPPARLDLASFATAANVCDEPVTRPNGTTEPRYRCDGIFSEGDETSLVLDNLKATMNAVLDDVDGKIRLSVLFNDLAAPIGSLTTADVLGEYTWDQTAPLSDSVNVIRGAYTDPSTASLYQMVDHPEVRIASTDGIDRVQTINLPLVQSAGQAQRLAKLRLARFQFGGTFTAVFQATAWKFQKGDAIRFSFYPLGWTNKLFRIADMTIQVDGTVPMMLREEDPAIYAAYSDETAAVQGAAPTVYDPQQWPIIQGIIDLDAQIARAVSDGWLDPSEKRQAKIDYDQRTAQRDALQQRYVDLGSPSYLASVRDNAFAKVQALYDYLQGLSPSWLDYTTISAVPDPAGYQAAWRDASQALEQFGAALAGGEGLTPEERAALAEAIARIEAMSSDSILSRDEKSQTIIDKNALVNDWQIKRTLSADYEASNPALGAARVAADNAVYAWDDYLRSLSPAWDDTATDTPINPTNYRNAWTLAYQRVSALSAQLNLALGPQIAAVSDRLARVASDGWLSAGEKPQAIIDKNALVADWTALRAKAADGLEAANPAIGAARLAADDAIYDWDDYLRSLMPAWDDVTVDTPIIPANYRNAWGLAYQKVADFNAALTAQPGEKGDNAPNLTVNPVLSQLKVDKTGAYVPGQSYSINVTRVELPGVPTFMRNDGYTDTAAGFAQSDPSSFSTTGPDNLTISAAGAIANMNAFGGAAGALTFVVAVPGSPLRATATIQKNSDGAQGANGASNTSATSFGGTPGTLVPPGATVTLETSVQVINNGPSGQFRVELYRQMQGGGSIVVQGVTQTIAAGGDFTFNLSGTYTNNTAANVFLQGAASAFRVSDGSNVGGQGYVRIY